MRIVITGPGTYESITADVPDPGMVYQLEDATEGSGAQNRAWHALVSEYWRSGCHSYSAKSFDDFRNQIKRALGAGFERFIYVTGDPPTIHDAAKLEDIPHGTPRNLIRGRLKSWSDYSKKERRESIDRLIAEMHEVGVQTKKFYSILEGMEGWKR